jgi:hypothetical protein
MELLGQVVYGLKLFKIFFFMKGIVLEIIEKRSAILSVEWEKLFVGFV